MNLINPMIKQITNRSRLSKLAIISAAVAILSFSTIFSYQSPIAAASDHDHSTPHSHADHSHTSSSQQESSANTYVSEIVEADLFTAIGVIWPATAAGEIELRFHKDGQWTQWYHIDAHHDFIAKDNESVGFFPINPATAYQYKIVSHQASELAKIQKNIRIETLHEKAKTNYHIDRVVASLTNDFTNIVLPHGQAPVISRGQWGANEDLRVYRGEVDDSESTTNNNSPYQDELTIIKKVTHNSNNEPLTWPLEYPEKVRKIFIHHTATTNNLDDPAQAIRNIYAWHATKNGWGDIGYNYIIDRDGNIYEGRFGGEGVVGGHVKGANTGSIGIAVLGNYEDTEISEESFAALAKLVAEKAAIHNIDISGSDYFRGKYLANVSGHRDFSATACPGHNIYMKLDRLRELAASGGLQHNSSQLSNADYAYDFINVSPQQPIQTAIGAEQQLTLTIRNTGQKTWFNAGRDLIAITDSSGEIIGLMNEAMVSRNSLATFNITLKAPNTLGNQSIQIKPVRGFDTNLDSSTISIDFDVTGRAYDSELIEIYQQRVFTPGDVVFGMIKLKNTGSQTWHKFGDNAIAFSSLVPGDGEILRVNLFEKEINPGEIGSFVFTIKAPTVEGTYPIYFRLWSNGALVNRDRIEYPIIVTTNPQNVIAPTPEPPQKPSDNSQQTNNDNSENSNFNPSLSAYEVKKAAAANNQIRIALSFAGDPIISGDGFFSVEADGNNIANLSKDQTVLISRMDNQYQLEFNGNKVLSQSPPRVIPGDSTILRIDNFDHSPAWNKNLNDNMYRGVLEANYIDDKLVVINQLPLEQYLKGLGEVSNSAPYAKIQSIIVSARTYAKYYMTKDQKFPGKPYHLNDDPNVSQKYLGYGLEKRSPRVNEAVKDTAREVITYNGELIKTPYFNQSDGRTRSAEEVWGWTNTPYLQSVPDTFCDATSLNGHGVGLSGCGATGMAEASRTYEQIIKYFYQDVEIETY